MSRWNALSAAVAGFGTKRSARTRMTAEGACALTLPESRTSLAAPTRRHRPQAVRRPVRDRSGAVAGDLAPPPARLGGLRWALGLGLLLVDAGHDAADPVLVGRRGEAPPRLVAVDLVEEA